MKHITSPEKLPIPDWHLRVIEERLAVHRANPVSHALGKRFETRWPKD
jgi:hypothetical protein